MFVKEELDQLSCYRHTVDYHLVTKQQSLLIHATTWMNLSIILRERNKP